jgi:hypothetical protein
MRRRRDLAQEGRAFAAHDEEAEGEPEESRSTAATIAGCPAGEGTLRRRRRVCGVHARARPRLDDRSRMQASGDCGECYAHDALLADRTPRPHRGARRSSTWTSTRAASTSLSTSRNCRRARCSKTVCTARSRRHGTGWPSRLVSTSIWRRSRQRRPLTRRRSARGGGNDDRALAEHRLASRKLPPEPVARRKTCGIWLTAGRVAD